jgi:hypothetical protein
MTDEARIAARLDALKRDPHFSGEDLVRLIRRDLARTPADQRSKLLNYYER